MLRDGPVTPDDPTKTKMQNAMHHIRTNPSYGGEVPKSMVLLALGRVDETDKFYLLGQMFLRTEEFEACPSEESLFKLVDGMSKSKCDLIIYTPCEAMPTTQEESQKLGDDIMKHVKEMGMGEYLQYMLVNGWFIAKPHVKRTGTFIPTNPTPTFLN